MKLIIQLAFKNILSYRKKSIAAVLSIASGFMSLNLFQSYIYDVSLLFDGTYSERYMYGDVMIRKQKRFETLNETEQKNIDEFLSKHKDQLLISVKQLYFSGSANNGSQQVYFQGIGSEVEKGIQMRQPFWANNVIYGRPLSVNLSNHPSNEITVGIKFSEILGCTPKKNLTLPIRKSGYHHPKTDFNCPFDNLQLAVSTEQGQVNALEAKIVGIQDGLYREIDEKLISSSLEFAQELTNTRSVSYYTIKLPSESQVEIFKELFNNEVQTHFPTILIDSWKNFDIGEFYQQTMSFLKLFRNFFSLIVISIGTLSVMATFYRLINERKKEMGIYRSIGIKSDFIKKLFLVESLLLSLIGIFIGLTCSAFVSGTFNFLDIPYSIGMLTQPLAYAMTLNLRIILFSSAISIISSLLFSYIPINQAMKIRITDILREN